MNSNIDCINNTDKYKNMVSASNKISDISWNSKIINSLTWESELVLTLEDESINTFKQYNYFDKIQKVSNCALIAENKLIRKFLIIYFNYYSIKGFSDIVKTFFNDSNGVFRMRLFKKGDTVRSRYYI